jgi:signal transduction histidine kinase
MSLGLSRFPITLVDGPENGEEYAKVRQTMYQEIDSFGVNTKIRSGTKTIDKSIKIYAYKGIKKLPLMVGVVMDEEDFLAGWRAARIKDAGFLAIFTVFGSVLSFFALTMARQIQRVEESESAAVLASQAKSEFLANMSHELRTPLNAINGFSEMLGSGYFGPLNPKQKERIHDINLCGGHLLQLITDILDFSKGDAGKLELVEEKVVVQDMVDETIRMMHEKLKSKHINLVTDVDMDLPKLFGDKRKIRQMLLNLLSNSIKFTPEEGTVKLAVRLDQFNNMILTVSDTGIGMAEDDIPVALSVFGQVHRSHNHEGTGLGLPLCKMFAELHGGKLAIGSTIGQGTTVRITFPQNRVLVNDEDSYEEQDNTLKLNISQRS